MPPYSGLPRVSSAPSVRQNTLARKGSSSNFDGGGYVLQEKAGGGHAQESVEENTKKKSNRLKSILGTGLIPQVGGTSRPEMTSLERYRKEMEASRTRKEKQGYYKDYFKKAAQSLMPSSATNGSIRDEHCEKNDNVSAEAGDANQRHVGCVNRDQDHVGSKESRGNLLKKAVAVVSTSMRTIRPQPEDSDDDDSDLEDDYKVINRMRKSHSYDASASKFQQAELRQMSHEQTFTTNARFRTDSEGSLTIMNREERRDTKTAMALFDLNNLIQERETEKDSCRGRASTESCGGSRSRSRSRAGGRTMRRINSLKSISLENEDQSKAIVLSSPGTRRGAITRSSSPGTRRVTMSHSSSPGTRRTARAYRESSAERRSIRNEVSCLHESFQSLSSTHASGYERRARKSETRCVHEVSQFLSSSSDHRSSYERRGGKRSDVLSLHESFGSISGPDGSTGSVIRNRGAAMVRRGSAKSLFGEIEHSDVDGNDERVGDYNHQQHGSGRACKSPISPHHPLLMQTSEKQGSSRAVLASDSSHSPTGSRHSRTRERSRERSRERRSQGRSSSRSRQRTTGSSSTVQGSSLDGHSSHTTASPGTRRRQLSRSRRKPDGMDESLTSPSVHKLESYGISLTGDDVSDRSTRQSMKRAPRSVGNRLEHIDDRGSSGSRSGSRNSRLGMKGVRSYDNGFGMLKHNRRGSFRRLDDDGHGNDGDDPWQQSHKNATWD